MKSAVSIVIPNWNGADLLQAHLPSVEKAQACYGGATELIVVDDASTDDSVAMLTKNFPRVRMVRHRRNKGFGQACGSGVHAANHPYIILLNSDVAVYPDFIEPLLKSFDDPSVFAASPLILDEHGKMEAVTISRPYFRRGKIRFTPTPPDFLRTDSTALPHPWYTLFPLGGAFAADKQRFLALEGFDPLFEPFFYEDTDLGFRAWKRGWTCVVVPQSRVTHFHTGTIARSFKHFSLKIISKRNRLLFLWKNLTTPRLFQQHLIFHLFRLFYSPFTLNGIVTLSTVLAISRFPAAMERRAREKKAVVRDEKTIFTMINQANQANCEAIRSAKTGGRI